jgi:transcriptional regulator with XRE-family HTH domain
MADQDEIQLAINIGRVFKRRRDELGLSLRQVEQATGISISQVNRIENGALNKPSFVDVLKLVEFYRIPITMITSYINTGYGLTPFSDKENEVRTLVETVISTGNRQAIDYLLQFLIMFAKHQDASA